MSGGYEGKPERGPDAKPNSSILGSDYLTWEYKMGIPISITLGLQ